MVSPNRSSATFGTLLRELRQSQNRTLEQMAALVSRAAGTPVSRVQIQAWEADTQPPDLLISGIWQSLWRFRNCCWTQHWPNSRRQPVGPDP